MQQHSFKIYGMDCAEEIALLKQVLTPHVTDVEGLHFDLLNGKLLISEEILKADEITIIKTINKSGLKAVTWEDYLKTAEQPTSFWQRNNRLILTILSGIFIVVGYVWHGIDHGFLNALVAREESINAFPLGAMIFFILAIIVGGWFIVPKAWLAAKRLRPDMNLLMFIAVIGAVIIGQWFEAATVTFLFSVALLLESWSINRARNAIKALLSIIPPTARVICQHHGDIEEKPVEEVNVGATIIIRPGEKIPLDAVIIKGETHINQAPITGESLPIVKKVGDVVYAGTINEEGVIECKVTKAAEDTTFAHIIKKVEEAQASRAKSEQWVEKFARHYTPIMILIAILIMIVPPLLFAGGWISWIYEGLVILVIACPCALVISTPVSIVAALSSAARAGILVKGGNYLELPAGLQAIAFDKTGTITEGKPVLQTLQAVNGTSEQELISIVASLEAESDHPLALAVKDYAKQKNIKLDKTDQVKVIKGKGVEGKVNGVSYWVGSHRLLHEKIKSTTELEKIHQQVISLEDAGHSLIIVGAGERLYGYLSIADQIRSASQQTIEQLRAMGLKTILLTGDNKGTAQAIGDVCHFDENYSELLPEDKLNKIVELREKYHLIAMVGDGINDAPALAAANLGIAMGAMGTDVAIETADIALMSDELEKLPWLIRHSKRTVRIIKQNISFSLGIKVIFILLAFAQLASLWMAIAADMGASFIVVTNGLRLLKISKTHIKK